MVNLEDLPPEDAEEFKKCHDSPAYFYNKYVRREGQPELTDEELLKIQEDWRRKTEVPLKFRSRPLTPDQCYPPKGKSID